MAKTKKVRVNENDLQELIRRCVRALEELAENYKPTDEDLRKLYSAIQRLLDRLTRDYFTEEEVLERLGITEEHLDELKPRRADELKELWDLEPAFANVIRFLPAFSRLRNAGMFKVRIEEYLRLRDELLNRTDGEPEPPQNARFRRDVIKGLG